MKLRLPVFALVLAALIALAPSALAQMPSPFSADMVMTPGREGGEAVNGKLFFGTNKVRMAMAARGHESVMITDIPKKVTYMLMPQQHMYMELRHDSPMMQRGPKRPEFKPYDASNPCANEEGVTCKKVGSETVNGRACDKWEFSKNGTLTSKNGTLTKTVWIDKSNHIPIKTVEANGNVFEFKNVKEGPQAASLFEVPSDYKRMDMGSMMGRPPQ